MSVLVAKVPDKANAERLTNFLKKAGSTYVRKTRKKDGTFALTFTEPNVLECYLLHNGEEGRKALNKILRNLDPSRRILGLLNDESSEAGVLRDKVIAAARKEVSEFPRYGAIG